MIHALSHIKSITLLIEAMLGFVLQYIFLVTVTLNWKFFKLCEFFKNLFKNLFKLHCRNGRKHIKTLYSLALVSGMFHNFCSVFLTQSIAHVFLSYVQSNLASIPHFDFWEHSNVKLRHITCLFLGSQFADMNKERVNSKSQI